MLLHDSYKDFVIEVDYIFLLFGVLVNENLHIYILYIFLVFKHISVLSNDVIEGYLRDLGCFTYSVDSAHY